MSRFTSTVLASASRWFPVFVAAWVAAACGGGGDDGGSSSSGSTERPASSAQGYYIGNVTGGTTNSFRMLVLENNEFWLVYGALSGSTLSIQGFVQGSGIYSAGTFTSTAAKDYTGGGAAAGTFGGSFKTSSPSFVTSVSGTANAFGHTLALAGDDNVLSLLYFLPASVSDISGSWPVSLTTGETGTLSVNAAGGLTLSSPRGCTGTGALVPRPSGKNVFNLTLTFGAAPCVLPGATFTGVAYVSSVSLSTQKQLTGLAHNSAQTLGLLMLGAR